MPSGKKSRNAIRKLLFWAGAVAIVAGTVQLLRIPLTYARVAYTQHILSQQKVAAIQQQAINQQAPVRITEYKRNAFYPAVASPGQQPKQRAYIGKLIIPKLGLTAPIRQGTALSILASTAGHLKTSVLPGELGTSLIAAHDVTYFHHIDELKAGDVIRVDTSQGKFEYKVQSHRIVHVGTNLINTSYPSLVLETCYPLNAIHLVNQRYVVRAALVKSSLTPHSSPS